MTRDGRKQVNGGPDLKDSQTYPDLFGYAVCSVAMGHKAELQAAESAKQLDEGAEEITLEQLTSGLDRWPDANVDPVLAVLMGCVDRRQLP